MTSPSGVAPSSLPPSPAGRLLRELRRDPVLAPVLAFVEAQMQTDAAHDLDHLLRVADWTVRLAVPAMPYPQAVAAALLHDVVNVAKHDAGRGSASERSAQAARELLTTLDWPVDAIDLVAEAIRQHSWSRGEPATSPLAIALRDADRLEALGVIGTFRCISTGVAFGADYVDRDDPWAEARTLDDRRHSIDHFFVKLFRVADGLVHPLAREEGARRVATMQAMLAALGGELGVPWAPPPSGHALAVEPVGDR